MTVLADSPADLRAAMGDIEYRNTTALLDAIPAAFTDIDAITDDAEDWWTCTG